VQFPDAPHLRVRFSSPCDKPSIPVQNTFVDLASGPLLLRLEPFWQLALTDFLPLIGHIRNLLQNNNWPFAAGLVKIGACAEENGQEIGTRM
jgi:hypothetical protein